MERERDREREREQERERERAVNYCSYTIRREKKSSGVSNSYLSGGYQRKDLPSKCLLRKWHEVNSTRMVVCITMYNEDMKEFLATMRGIMADVHRVVQSPEPIINPRSELVIVLIADGLEKVRPEFLQTMGELGLYSEEELVKHKFMEFDENKKYVKKAQLYATQDERERFENNVLHCFARDDVSNFGFEPKDCEYIYGGRQGHEVPVNFVFAIKHNNGGKLNSHLFFFHGFCEYLNPTYATLVDIGTEPVDGAISRLMRHMNLNLNCGGCCGEIEVETRGANCLTFVLVFAQYFEYKISNYLDKAAEQFYGFISVLPGAFSMFRMDSIRGRPLQQYFAGLNTGSNSCFKANMYLAEDRIQCLEILTHEGQRNDLAFVSGAAALTDPPERLGVLLKQRRRWINGSNFAQFYVIKNFCRLSRTAHSKCRKCFIYIFYLYYMVNAFFTFVLVGMFYASFSIMLRNFFGDVLGTEANENSSYVRLFENGYLVLLVWMVLISLTADANLVQCQIQMISIIFGFFMFFFMALAVVYFYQAVSNDQTVSSPTIRYLTVAAMFVVMLSQIVPLLLNCRRCNCCKLVIGFVCYVFLTPTYVNLFITYAFCNIHDVSWGNRDSASLENRKKQEEFKLYRSRVLMLWLLLNMASGYLMNLLARGELDKSANEAALLIFAIFVAFTVTFRLLSSICAKFKCSRARIADHPDLRKPVKPWEPPREPKMLKRGLAHFDRNFSEGESTDADGDIDASPVEKRANSIKPVHKTFEKKATQNFERAPALELRHNH